MDDSHNCNSRIVLQKAIVLTEPQKKILSNQAKEQNPNESCAILFGNVENDKMDKLETELNVNANTPNAKHIDKMTSVVALALLLVDTPPSKIPADKKIKPNIIVRPVSACIPSIKV